MNRSKVSIITLGCKVNQYESHSIENYLQSNSFEIVPFSQKSDIVIINTCAVTQQAARKSRQIIRQAKRNNPDSLVIVMGCIVQQQDLLNDLSETVDVVLGTNNKGEVIDIINNWVTNPTGISHVAVTEFNSNTLYEEMPAPPIGNRVRAEVKIQDGCQQFCSYCIIPYLRGPERSRMPEKVIAEINQLEEKGFQEIVLTGIHLGAYGKDLSPDDNLTALLRKILHDTQVKRIRLSSVEPTDVSDDLVNLIAQNKRIAPHFHIPLQGGNDKLLQDMNRKYTTKDYRDIVDSIRRRIPEAAITTDIIVGFPGESDLDFQESKEFVTSISFSNMHIFRFSPRAGTPAAKMKQKIRGDIARDRSNQMHELAKQMSYNYHFSMVGKQFEVLLEQYIDGHWEGHAENYVKVKVNGQNLYKNMLINVQICDSDAYCAIGNVL